MSDLVSLAGKKLLILGGNPETGVLVKIANTLDIFTIVIDPNSKSPAKQFAKKHYNIDGFDIDNLVRVAKDEKVDGVLVGVADILVKPYYQLCEELELPCYATLNIIDALCSKDGFMEACNIYGIQTIPSFSLDKNFNTKDLKKIHHFTENSVIDLNVFAPTLGFESIGAKKLSALVLGIRISKKQQVSNWAAEHLSHAQLDYAATDAWICREIYLRLI